ncbi:unnamed protein product [Dibothriocephalus latus]|uniref:Uncharacterized protein n=1 Tax=Dibothriocephalus latus TaxID=60516 RepID=A0A3P7MHE0_DIBLA|nr:unnamed protein product [Dibothriocephalus latus]
MVATSAVAVQGILSSLRVPARADEITIPADVTPERVPTEIVDFSFRTQTQDQLVEEIRRATVICLVYALDNENTIHPIEGRWLPLICSCFKATEARVPVVLVGNKLDLVPNSKMEVSPKLCSYARHFLFWPIAILPAESSVII